MKFLTSQLLVLVQQKRSRHNIVLLLRFLVALCGLIAVYSVFFHFIMEYEGHKHSWLTGLYWTLTVMSTLGFGDITFETDLGRLFSIIVLMSGIIFLLILLPFTFIQFFYAPWVEAQAAARTPRFLPESTRGHVILTDHDAVSATLIRKLTQFGNSHVVLCANVDEAHRLHDLGISVMIGELDDPETYRLARAQNAAMVVATQTDALNSNIAFTVREVAPNVPIISTAIDAASIPILELAGATTVLQLREVLGQALARCTIGGDAVSHVVGNVDELLIAEASAYRTPLVGQTLRESRLRDLGVNVVGFWDRGGFSPAAPDAVIGPTTILVLAGSAEQLQHYNEQFAIYNVSGEPVIILGGGSIGRAAARALEERGFNYRIIEQRPDRAVDPDRTIVGNAASLEVLERAGIHTAPAVLVTTHDDSINLYLTIFCRRLCPNMQIIARVNADRNVATLHRAGADFVLSFASMGANSILNLLTHSRLITVTEGLEVFRTPVPEALIGKSIAQCGIREKTGCTIVALKPIAGGPLITTPPSDLKLSPDHEMVIVGDSLARERFGALGR